jgi:hypothetical protein
LTEESYPSHAAVRRRPSAVFRRGAGYIMDNAKVHDWAQEAIDKYNTYVVHENLENAFGYLKGLRQAGNTDLELAAADHYMFVRLCNCLVGTTPLFGLGVIGASIYDGPLKLIDTVAKKAIGMGLPIGVGPTPTSPFSPWTLAWDYTGLLNGAEDSVYRWGLKKLHVPKYPVPLPIIGSWIF